MKQPRDELAALVRWIHSKGWAAGTGGNYSVKLSDSPLRLLMTPSGVDKGCVEPEDLIEVDEQGRVITGKGRPSAETLIHVAIVSSTKTTVVVHTHSVANTVLSLGESLELRGYEMLKALQGVETHVHAEPVPILENSQEVASFSSEVSELLRAQPQVHGFLMRGHGLYTWGNSFFEAKRHLEAFEFLFEVELARRTLTRNTNSA